MQLIRCDRCKKTESGHIKEPGDVKDYHGTCVGKTERRPSISGWELIRVGSYGVASLLCPECVALLRAWLNGEEKQKKTA